MSTQPRRGVAPAARPQLTPPPGQIDANPLLWWIMALLIVVLVVAVISSI